MLIYGVLKIYSKIRYNGSRITSFANAHVLAGKISFELDEVFKRSFIT